MELVLPFAGLSGNAYYRIFRGRYCISAKGREFREKVKRTLAGKPKIEGKIALEIEFHFKDKRKRDVDNYLKTAIDALKHRCFGDDSLIYELKACKYIGKVDKTVVKIRKIS